MGLVQSDIMPQSMLGSKDKHCGWGVAWGQLVVILRLWWELARNQRKRGYAEDNNHSRVAFSNRPHTRSVPLGRPA